jgi:hypothetical protein
MQTLLDPFELAPASFAPSSGERLRAAPTPTQPSFDVEVDFQDLQDVQDSPAPIPPGPDSSGRLRCWCSED